MTVMSNARSRGVLVALTLFVAALASLMLSTSANATPTTTAEPSSTSAPYPPSEGCTVSVSNGTVQPGQSVNLVGSGFPADQDVALSVSSKSASLGSVRTDSEGNFATTVDIPFNIGTGDHTINAASASTTCSFGFGTEPAEDNRPPADTPVRHASDSGPTANTGFQTLTASIIAGILLIGGGVLLLLGRRRGNA